jgi:hypothetical protein
MAKTVNSELHAWGDLIERRIGAFATRQAIRDHAYVMAAVGLAICKVQDVAESSTYRRAQCVQDAERLRTHGNCLNSIRDFHRYQSTTAPANGECSAAADCPAQRKAVLKIRS